MSKQLLTGIISLLIIVFGAIIIFPKSWINPIWQLAEKDTCIAVIDTTILIPGIKGKGYNQHVQYHFSYDSIIYTNSFRASNLNGGELNPKDEIEVVFKVENPMWHKRLSYKRRKTQSLDPERSIRIP